MRRHKVSILVFLFLISFASFAFASIAMMWPIDSNPHVFNFPNLVLPEKPVDEVLDREVAPSAPNLNYQAWRRIQTSA